MNNVASETKRLLGDEVLRQAPELQGWKIVRDGHVPSDCEVRVLSAGVEFSKGRTFDAVLGRYVEIGLFRDGKMFDRGRRAFTKIAGEKYDNIVKFGAFVSDVLDDKDPMNWPKKLDALWRQSRRDRESIDSGANATRNLLHPKNVGLDLTLPNWLLAVGVPRRVIALRTTLSEVRDLALRSKLDDIADDLIQSAYLLGRQVREAEIIRDFEIQAISHGNLQVGGRAGGNHAGEKSTAQAMAIRQAMISHFNLIFADMTAPMSYGDVADYMRANWPGFKGPGFDQSAPYDHDYLVKKVLPKLWKDGLRWPRSKVGRKKK